MDVYDFCNLCTDDSVEVHIFDMNENICDEVFCGTAKEAADSRWKYCEVESYDLNFNDKYFCLNITTDEDKDDE